jgi:hypothetical protein
VPDLELSNVAQKIPVLSGPEVLDPGGGTARARAGAAQAESELPEPELPDPDPESPELELPDEVHAVDDSRSGTGSSLTHFCNLVPVERERRSTTSGIPVSNQ